MVPLEQVRESLVGRKMRDGGAGEAACAPPVGAGAAAASGTGRPSSLRELIFVSGGGDDALAYSDASSDALLDSGRATPYGRHGG